MVDIFNKENIEKDYGLELAVEDAIFRIKREYERTNGKIYLSFSGGKDSTVVANLIMMANLPTKIPFVYSDTGLEFDVIRSFVKAFPYDNVVILKPDLPFSQIIKTKGKPALSKLKSGGLSTYQKHIDEPLKTARARQMITGKREKNGIQIEGRNSYKIPNKYMHFIHPDTEFKIANECCSILKKKPFEKFAKERDMYGTYTGVRQAEGGVRSMVYKSCVDIKQKNGHEFYTSMPIIDWTDEVLERFIKKYNIKISDAYTVYGCTRTGCCGCPFSPNLKNELKILHDYEPNKYKAMMFFMKDVYMYQLVECEWDEEYMKEFNEKLPIIKQRNKEMIEKFRPKK